MRLLLSALLCVPAARAGDEVTFYKDVFPILQKNCEVCHRAGEAAPMSFHDYLSVRPWAVAIKEAVLPRKMPPWFADPRYGRFSNDRSLSDDEIRTLVEWADAGAKRGDPKDSPAHLDWVEGWSIPKPDAVFEMPRSVSVPAKGAIDYQYVVLPTGFTEDRWIRMAEIRPGDRSVVHHVIAFLRPKGSKWLADAIPGVPFVPAHIADQDRDASMLSAEFLVGYAPGMPAQVSPRDTAKLIPAGADLVLQLHYTANGFPALDKSKIGVVFADEPPLFREVTLAAANSRFRIPPGDPAYEVRAQITLDADTQLVAMMPHMHLRGKDFLYRIVYPGGGSEIALSVPRYDFSWQLAYRLAKPIALPKGSRIECVAHFDNSLHNQSNPNAAIEVHWGDQSWDEMMIGFFDVIFPVKAPPTGD